MWLLIFPCMAASVLKCPCSACIRGMKVHWLVKVGVCRNSDKLGGLFHGVKELIVIVLVTGLSFSWTCNALKNVHVVDSCIQKVEDFQIITNIAVEWTKRVECKRQKRSRGKWKVTRHWETTKHFLSVSQLSGQRHVLLLLSAVALACAAPLNARSRWLCCLASCSKVSSSLTRWSRSAWRAFCHRLLWAWASARKSRHAWRGKNIKQPPLVSAEPQF